jgi:hypothetical protein
MLRRVAHGRTHDSEELSEERSVRRLLVTANVIPSSRILVTLMMEAPSSSETSALTRATRDNIPEDAIFHGHRRENLKSYIDHSNYTWQLLPWTVTLLNSKHIEDHRVSLI